MWYHTKVWKGFVLVLLLCRQFLVVERTVILFSYWMKCLVWMLFIWGDILYMGEYFSPLHTICFKVDTEVSLYKVFTLVLISIIKRWVNVSVVFVFPSVYLCHYLDATLFLSAFILYRNSLCFRQRSMFAVVNLASHRQAQ